MAGSRMNPDSLIAKIESRSATVAVVGLGYVGLPLALTFAEKGLTVIGFDVDERKVADLASGTSYVGHISEARIQSAFNAGLLSATNDAARLQEADAILITVPTPLDSSGNPDLRFVEATAETISTTLKKGQLVVLESTTYPGTTEEVLRPILERSGLEAGKDFWIAYSPEREDPGNPTFSTSTIPKVIGAHGEDATRLTSALYSIIVPQVVTVSSPRAAEATKLTENIFRAVNIALVNELKLAYEKLDVDIWEVLDAAETKPFGFMRFNPGPGWGGHCIPIDPFYLSWAAQRAGAETEFIRLAGEINRRMADHVVERLKSELAIRDQSIRGAKILVLGIAYKPDVDDPRESPAFPIMKQLLEAGAQLSYHDPFVPVLPQMRSWPTLPPLLSQDLEADLLREVDAVLLLTGHSDVDYELVQRFASLIVDTRGKFSGDSPSVVRA